MLQHYALLLCGAQGSIRTLTCDTVPGGQALYIRTDGALSYTQAHSSYMPDLLHYGGGIAFSNAGYFGPNSTQWAACRDANVDERYWIAADLPEVDLHDLDCEGIYLEVHNQPAGECSEQHRPRSGYSADSDQVCSVRGSIPKPVGVVFTTSKMIANRSQQSDHVESKGGKESFFASALYRCTRGLLESFQRFNQI